jgi:hypothetical protein
VTDEELLAEVEALLATGDRGENQWADGTPEGQPLWELTHPTGQPHIRFPIPDRLEPKPWRP